ncbi:MAG: 2-methylfumaryl-CoA isomerase [Acetobacteraceae bacterium]
MSAFVAAPLGGLTLAQLGAEVIRIDPLGGNIDYRRWPLAPGGTSLYWASLNKGKRSVALALDKPEGREIAQALICRDRPGGANVLTNLPASGWLDYAILQPRCPGLIMARLIGNADGTSAVDYTINPASGFPLATGPGGAPVNHVLPAWDMAAGLYLCTGLLAADRVRARTGQGQQLTLALSDVMLATVANLGYVADVQVNGTVRPPLGNDLYGAFGRDFPTRDGRRVMVVAISGRQWQAIGKATGLADRLAMIGPMLGVDLATEGGRFEARDAIASVLAPWIRERDLSEVMTVLGLGQVLVGAYQDFGQLVREDIRCSTANPMFGTVQQAGVGDILAPASPLSFGLSQRAAPASAPAMGQDTERVLSEQLRMTGADLAGLHDRGVIALCA